MKETQIKYAAYSASTKKLVSYKIRHEDKDGKKTKNPYWKPHLSGVLTKDLELYGAREIHGAATVVIVEGEHIVGDLAKLGITAVSPFYQSPSNESLADLLGVDTVVVWADKDKAGADKADAITDAILAVGHPNVRRVLWPDAPPKGDARDAIRLGVDVHKLIADAIVVDRPKAAQSKLSQAEHVVKMAELVSELWHDEDGNGYATVEKDGHHQVWPISSRAYRNYISALVYESHGKVMRKAATDDALGILQGKAQFEGTQHQTHLRVGSHDGNIILDLANDSWEVVEITPNGWDVVANSPIKFRRPDSLRSLPTPVGGGDLDELLSQVLNVEDDDIPLLRSICVNSLFPRGPYPVGAIHGEAGSAKTTMSRLLKALVDPSKAPVRSLPRSEEDLIVAASNSWLLVFDNASSISVSMSDNLCRLSTGGGIAVRRLYTNDQDFVLDVMRPVVINGITPLAERGDLLDRTIPIDLPMIDDDDRLDEEEFWTAFNNLHPRLLGALLDAVSGALRELPNTHGKWPRMADFARRAIAAEKGMGRDDSSDIRFGNFIDRYRANIEGANETALTTSIIGLPVVDLMSTRSSWEGTASQLLVKLTAVIDESARQQKDWKSLKGSEVGKQLRRLTPNLRKAGIKVTHRVGKSRMIRLEAS